MEFRDVYEQEKLFPFNGISIEKARELKYFFNNLETLNDGEIVQLSLNKDDDRINANGMFAGNKENICFNSIIKPIKNGYKFYNVFTFIPSEKEIYSIDVFVYQEEYIKQISCIEGSERTVKVIPYIDLENDRKR